MKEHPEFADIELMGEVTTSESTRAMFDQYEVAKSICKTAVQQPQSLVRRN